MMDVRNRRCEEPDCTRQPSYGKEGQRRQFCFTHKRPGDVDVKSTRYGMFFDPKLKLCNVFYFGMHLSSFFLPIFSVFFFGGCRIVDRAEFL